MKHHSTPPRNCQSGPTHQGDDPFTKVPKSAMNTLDGDGVALAVLVALCRRANAQGQCWPSYATIAKELGFGRSGIQHAIDRIEAAGVITIEGRRRASGGWTSNMYTIHALVPLQIQQSPLQIQQSPLQIQHYVERDPIEQESMNEAPNGATPLTPHPGFDDFWSIYPNKAGKQAAIKAWNKLHPDGILADAIITAVTAQAASYDWQKADGQYVPMGSTYLNGARWEDPVRPPPSSNGHRPNELSLDDLIRAGGGVIHDH